jgi:sugar lactone lactonase YvrE
MTLRKVSMLLLGLALGCGEQAAEDCEPAAGRMCTVIGSGVAGFNGDGKTALDTDVYLPMDVGRGPDGLLYFIDWNNHRVRRIAGDGKVETIAGTGMLGDGPVGQATAADFNHPTSFTFDKVGRMIISAWHNSRIKRVDLATGELEDLCGTGKRAYSGEDGPAKTADLDLPASVALDADDNLFVMDQANQIIRKIDGAGTISRVAGMCITGPCAEGETPTACEGSNKLACLTTDPMGCTKPCAPAYGGDGGPALEARLAQPFGQSADPAGRIVFDAMGNLYLADTGNHRVRRIDTAGMITTVAGTGEAGFSGDGAAASQAKLQRPVDLDVGADGTLYIADTFNSCVRALDAKGTIRTVAGVCGKRGHSGDAGESTEMLLDRPYGVGVDGDKLYITDTYNHRVVAIGL